MIGFYDYTVILTYISFISAVAGIFSASTMQLRWAIFFLAFSGLCDMFDGKVARTKKNRTADEQAFGIQIDSLCDIVCFGILPIVICYKLGMDRIYSMAILALYGLAGLIRLGYFNVMEAKRQAEEGGGTEVLSGFAHYFHGDCTAHTVSGLTAFSQPCSLCGGTAYCSGTGGFFVCSGFQNQKTICERSACHCGGGGSGSGCNRFCLEGMVESGEYQGMIRGLVV